MNDSYRLIEMNHSGTLNHFKMHANKKTPLTIAQTKHDHPQTDIKSVPNKTLKQF